MHCYEVCFMGWECNGLGIGLIINLQMSNSRLFIISVEPIIKHVMPQGDRFFIVRYSVLLTTRKPGRHVY